MYFKTLEDLTNSDIFNGQHDKSEFMILVGKNTKSELNELMNFLNPLGVKYFGGFFPKLIANGQAQSTGFIVKKLNSIYSERVHPFLMKKAPILEEGKAYTGIILGDGLSDKIKDLIDTVTSKIKGNINYIGGCGARYIEKMGVPTVEQGAALFKNNEFFQDAFHLCIIEEESKTNIALGWEVLDGPFKVTNMKNNTVCELDYKNPYELYQNTIEAAESTVIIQDNHTSNIMSHPFALMENGQIKNIILPDDISKDGHLKFLRADLRQGDDIYILRGDQDSLIQGVKDELSSAMTSNVEITVFSCFTREFILDDKFSDEIKCIDQKYKISAEGTLSFGEFSNHNEKKELRIYAGACVITF